jgi:cell division protein FtsX
MLSWKLFAVSFWAFIVVNLLENIIYYNIGKHSIQDFQLSIPTNLEILSIILIMLVFAGLQALIISYFA